MPTLPVPVDGDNLRRLKPVEDIRRVSDDDFLVPLTAEKVSRSPLAGGMEVDLRLVDSKDVCGSLG